LRLAWFFAWRFVSGLSGAAVRRARGGKPITNFPIAHAFAAYGIPFLFVRSGGNYLSLFAWVRACAGAGR
jgi:hypothetical protein